MLDDETRYLVETKIGDLKRMYEGKLIGAGKKIEFLNRQVMLFERLQEDGNVFVRMEDMNAQAIVRKLSIVEKNPRVVWESVQKVFGFGFLSKVIEEDYGITPDFKDSIMRDFTEELAKLKNELGSKVKRLSQSFRNELESLRRLLAKKNADIARVAL